MKKSVCHLDSLSERDFNALKRLYTDTSVRRYLGGALSDEAASQRVRGLLNERSLLPTWAIRGDAGELMGMVSLDHHYDGEDVEVSYLLLPEFQGQGIATIAVKLALQHALEVLQLEKVVAETQTANTRSTQLLRRVGMKRERELIRFGEPQSIFSKSRESFFADR